MHTTYRGDKKSFLVIGLGRFGTSVALNLVKLGCEVVVTDVDEEKVTRLADMVTEGVVGDVQNEEFLKSLGISNFDAVVVGIGYDIKASVLVVTLVKGLGAKMIVAKAYDALHVKILERLGVEWPVSVEDEMGRRVAMGMKSEHMIDYMELTPDFRFVEMEIVEGWEGKAVGDVKAFKNHDLMLVAIKRGNEVITMPSEEVGFLASDILVVCGRQDKLAKVE